MNVTDSTEFPNYTNEGTAVRSHLVDAGISADSYPLIGSLHPYSFSLFYIFIHNMFIFFLQYRE